MSLISGTITGVTLARAKGTRKAYILTVDFAAYTGSSDSMTVTGIGAAIAAKTRNGKTNTLRSAVCVAPGFDTNAQAVYAGALSVSSDDVTGNLAVAAGSEITATTATTGVEILAVVDES